MAVVCILSKILCHRADPPISVSCRTTVQFHAQLKLERFYRHPPHPPILLSHNPQCSQYNHYQPILLDNKKFYRRLPDKQITCWRGRYNGPTDDWPILGSSAQLSWVARGDTTSNYLHNLDAPNTVDALRWLSHMIWQRSAATDQQGQHLQILDTWTMSIGHRRSS